MADDDSRRPTAEGLARVCIELQNIRAAANLLFDRSLGMESDDAQAVGYLAERLEDHAEQALSILKSDRP